MFRWCDVSNSAASGRHYWNNRFDLLYYQYVYLLCRVVGREAKTALDVGSRATPFLEWLPWIDERVSVDLELPYSSPTVTGLKADFFEYAPERRFDLVTCLQVLEHVPEAPRFAQKLLEVSRHLVVSVPFEWSNKAPGHVHDPVTLEKLTGWVGRPPNFHVVVEELFAPRTNSRRLIAYYDIDQPDRQITIADRKARQPSRLTFAT